MTGTSGDTYIAVSTLVSGVVDVDDVDDVTEDDIGGSFNPVARYITFLSTGCMPHVRNDEMMLFEVMDA